MIAGFYWFRILAYYFGIGTIYWEWTHLVLHKMVDSTWWQIAVRSTTETNVNMQFSFYLLGADGASENECRPHLFYRKFVSFDMKLETFQFIVLISSWMLYMHIALFFYSHSRMNKCLFKPWRTVLKFVYNTCTETRHVVDRNYYV